VRLPPPARMIDLRLPQHTHSTASLLLQGACCQGCICNQIMCIVVVMYCYYLVVLLLLLLPPVVTPLGSGGACGAAC